MPYEDIIQGDPSAMWINIHSKFTTGRRVVALKCHHFAYTRNLNRVKCPRCAEMMRRSLEDGSEDWDGFRHYHGDDDMEWEDDPLRMLNERL